MAVLDFARSLEAQIVVELKKIDDSSGLYPLAELVLEIEQIIIDGLPANSEQMDAGTVISIDRFSALNEAKWQAVYEAVSSSPDKQLEHLSVLLGLYALLEKSGQFYQQAAIHSSYPNTKLFLDSIYQIKNIVRNRVNAVLSIVNNQIWEKVGFAPFLLGK